MTLESKKTYNPTPLTGTRVGKGPDNHYMKSDREVLELSTKMGKRIEKIAFDVWTGEKIARTWTKAIDDNSQLIRNELKPLTRKTYNKNDEVLPFYSKLTLVPSIPGFGNDISEPTSEHLRILFKTIDHISHAGLMSEFRWLSESYPGSGVDRRIKHLVESSLIISRLVTEDFPITVRKAKLIPNVCVKSVLQFDGVLLHKTAQINGSTHDDMVSLFSETEYVPVEVKVDYRNRNITGYNSPIDKGPEKRHIRELQIKLGRLLVSTNGNVNLPPIVYLIFLRGLREHVVHPIHVNRQFINQWLDGVQYNLRNNPYPELVTDDMLSLSLILEEKLGKTKDSFSNLPPDKNDMNFVQSKFM